METNNQQSINLNKYISSSGVCSRREAEKFIKEGRITINGKKTQLGNRVGKKDVVKFDGRLVEPKNITLYIALNKPVGIVSTTDDREPNNIVKHVNCNIKVFENLKPKTIFHLHRILYFTMRFLKKRA